MKKGKGSSILLYKEANTQADSRGLNISTSRSRLRNDLLKKLSSENSTPRIRPIEYSLNSKPSQKACNMEDPQVRIKRDFSPLYQKSTQESQLFEKGLKKPEININLVSRINLTSNNHGPANQAEDLSPRVVKRSDPNKQAENILELGSKPLLTNRSVHKKNPNLESDYKEPRKQKSFIKDPNIESNGTADYVIKSLTSHPSTQTKDIHIKFTKKENILSAQNITNENCEKIEQGLTKQHKRHFSHLNLQANKENIERKQNGICMKEDFTGKKKHQRGEFNHDFYKKQNRMTLHTQRDENQIPEKMFTMKTTRNDYQPKSRTYLKTQHHENKMAQLRKRFL